MLWFCRVLAWAPEKDTKIVEICKKFSTKCGVFFIIWRFPFPDEGVLMFAWSCNNTWKVANLLFGPRVLDIFINKNHRLKMKTNWKSMKQYRGFSYEKNQKMTIECDKLDIVLLWCGSLNASSWATFIYALCRIFEAMPLSKTCLHFVLTVSNISLAQLANEHGWRHKLRPYCSCCDPFVCINNRHDIP
jgi:hypothetical protein